jgi:hypothetical protein
MQRNIPRRIKSISLSSGHDRFHKGYRSADRALSILLLQCSKIKSFSVWGSNMGVSDSKAYKTETSKKIIFVIASFILRFLIVFHVLSLRRIKYIRSSLLSTKVIPF